MPNLAAKSNILLEYMNESGEVVHREESHNLVVNGGLGWMMMRLFNGVISTNEFSAPTPTTTNYILEFGRGDSGEIYIPVGTQTELRDTGGKPTHILTRDTDVSFTAPSSVVIDVTIPQERAPAFHIKEIGVKIGTRLIAASSGPPDYDNTGDGGAALGPLHVRILYQLINAV